MLELQVCRSNIQDARIVDRASAPLAAGGARLKIDLFSLTANNITYAAMGGPPLGYWDFFSAAGEWGRSPCWGFATIVESHAPGVEPGTRVYGYFPIAEMLDVEPTRVGSAGFFDGASQRAGKAPIYNQYFNVAEDPAYDPAYEPEQTLFRPLYATGWWAADCIHEDAPRLVVLSSASAKTALSTAHRLLALGGVECVALTSARNADYVGSTGLYDQVLTYDEIDRLKTKEPSVYVDFLGRDGVSAAVHRRLGPALKRSLVIGAADWADKTGGERPPREDWAGPKREFFFVPTYAAGRLKSTPQLGAEMTRDLRAFYAISQRFTSPRIARGAAVVLDAWKKLAAGEVDPREGCVLSF